MNLLAGFASVVAPYTGYGPMTARLALGTIFVAHGAQKLFAWFGGPGLRATNQMFGQIGLRPGAFWGTLVGIVEFLGGVCVLLGLATRESRSRWRSSWSAPSGSCTGPTGSSSTTLARGTASNSTSPCSGSR